MEIIKVGFSSSTFRYAKGEERMSVLQLCKYLGFSKTLLLIHGVKDGSITYRDQMNFYCSMSGVEGYPVACFIDFLENFYGIELKSLH